MPKRIRMSILDFLRRPIIASPSRSPEARRGFRTSTWREPSSALLTSWRAWFHSPAPRLCAAVTRSLALLCAASGVLAQAQESSPDQRLREQVQMALRRGVEFFRAEVAVEGTYLWQYSDDLSKREGENRATATQGWVQPPGTPAVGLAFLSAWQATSNSLYLEAARETAHGLARGQLRSGGWTYLIDFDPAARRRIAYRDGGNPEGRNMTTFDDDTTQAALRFLMRTDRALEFRDAKIHEAVAYALASILKAQYPNGAWPQGYDQFPDPQKFPVNKASYPENWPRQWPGSGQYWFRYTLNDNALATTVETLFEAERTYAGHAGQKLSELARDCRRAAEKAGDFLLLAQMPEPQPAWAQQYDFNMNPAWARRFEPPAITGGESQGVLRTLLMLYRQTGDRKYVAPVPRAVEYLQRSRLPDGRLARFYELQSNRPLYFTKQYVLTYDDTDLPTHYAFKVGDSTSSILREYERLMKLSPAELRNGTEPSAVTATAQLVTEVKAILAAQDDSGRWVESGRLRTHGGDDPTRRVIRSATFIRHVETLSRYLSATAR